MSVLKNQSQFLNPALLWPTVVLIREQKTESEKFVCPCFRKNSQFQCMPLLKTSATKKLSSVCKPDADAFSLLVSKALKWAIKSYTYLTTFFMST